MVFVTVGAQIPFARLVRAVDEWADRPLLGYCSRRRNDRALRQATFGSPSHL